MANYSGIFSVIVTVDGIQFNVAVDGSGGWSLNYTTVRTGSVSVVVGLFGHGNFSDFSNSTTFTVVKNSTNSTVVVSPNPVSIGNNVTVSGVLANFTGISGVNVTVDGTLFNVPVDGSGYWVLNYTTNRTGNLTVGVGFAGNDNYTSFTNSTNFTVNVVNKSSTNSTIVVSPNSVQIGENVTVSGVLANFTGISGVNVTVDGTIFNVPVDGSGYWVLNYTTNRTGNLTVGVGFAGNDNYTSFTNSTNFTVNVVNKSSTNSTIVVNPDSVNFGENITVSGVLANHTGIGFVNVTVDGTLFNVAVDASGYWELNYTTNRTGTDLEVIVSFAGNENYTAFSNSTTFNVTKLAVNSTINVSGTVKVGKTITIDGVLVDENGSVVANALVSVSVGGKVYSLKTDNRGRWSLTYKPTHVGSVNTVLNYAGNNKYFSYTNTTTFNVVKGKVIVDVDVVKNSDGSADVIAKVTDEDNDPIPNYKVSVELDGKHFGYIVTDVNGVGRIHIPSNKLNDGNHVITVISDDKNYNDNPVSAEFKTQNNDNDNNDTNGTNKANNSSVATAAMKNTGMPIIAIVLVLLTIFGIGIRRKED
ncbi:hypothetical protein MBCUT_08130 [Methanobrevibacter cuticularis]|uniref:Bacterial Ig-like domain protein n=1 Tax=Methanobrevibacter cuticularis TaxID=47311 RepID=A0A166CSB3_9EURY|nr:hypothetical protein MBCUT_08130 [Methanobrevibacter cuticularis]